MKKKAFIGLGQAIKWAIALLVASIIIFILFFPDQLFDGAKRAIFFLGSEIRADERIPQFEGRRVAAPLELYFDGLADRIGAGLGFYKAALTHAPYNCLIEIKDIPDMGNYNIHIVEDEIQMVLESDEGDTPPDRIRKSAIDFIPCEIIGSAAVRFSGCYIYADVSGCNTLFTAVSQIQLEEYGNFNYLFKTKHSDGTNYICAFTFYNDFFNNDCPAAPRSSGADGLDNDCISNLRSAIIPSPEFLHLPKCT